MEPRHSQIAKSLQNLLQIVEIYNSSSCRLRARSLPNIAIPTPDHYCQYHPSEYNNPECGSAKKHHHNKILKKTWDKVKTAIIHTASHSNRRTSLNKTKLDSNSSKGLQATTSTSVSSAPSTPLQKQTFDFDGQNCTNQQQLQTMMTTPSRPNSSNFLRSVSANAGDMKTHENEGESCTNRVGESIPNLEEESQKIQQSYAKLQKRLSEELHQRMSEHKPDTNKTAIDNLSEDFKKRLRQWEMWKFISTGKVTYTDEELQQILPEDFSQRLHEWETIKSSGMHSHSSSGQHSKTPDSLNSGTTQNTRETSSPEIVPLSTKNKLLRKKKSSSESSRQKELAWLEKQLEKIEVEKKRLEREMKKNVEREARLEKMKEALQNTSPSEVWIRTPTAKCKVEKLTEKFTKKLYEWEEMQGIQPESSTMALLHPKYYGPPPEEDDEMENRAQAAFNKARYDDDTQARDSESRQDECEVGCDVEEEGTEHEDTDFDHDHDQDPPRLIEQEQRISSSSSSDFEEATDSFATHDKANSGASNTDSDFYRAEFPTCRRRSSEAISTPLSARSPSISAFTSDDEAEACGLLKTVSEENENSNTLKDAESQTEIILKAKPVLVEDDDENEESYGEESQAGIFVQTKRTIFTPIVDESEPEKLVLIDGDLKSPSLIRKVVQQSQPLEIRTVSPTQKTPSAFLPSFSSSSHSFSMAHKPGKMSPISNPPSPGLIKPTFPRPPPPRIVEVTPKIHPNNALPQKSFPKMGKIPVWCSPLGTRRHLGSGGGSSCHSSEVGHLNDLAASQSRQHSSSVDFGTDRFLTESNLFSHQHGSIPCSSTSLITTTIPPQSKIPFINSKTGRRNTSASSTAVPEEIGFKTIQTGQRHPALPKRSSSFRIHRNLGTTADNELSSAAGSREGGGNNNTPAKGFYAHLKSRVGNVSKSQSTGSIRSKLGKAFSTFTNRISPKEHAQGPSTSNSNNEQRNMSNCKNSDGSTIDESSH